ncbi:hypothetical protein DFA_04187 [Cavenderia fasciculata]|uniref:Ankyrin repeat-containing protein n=1 Tax=Cavenderia fasciculata TaxID=261658 RepID=F4Q1J0_CACFS|nr:uncharacterized protein DFA_04187 [Cavenderia fasciculata]EGG18691.1 hypothetical protein DFA_04187 [Cavenderia fasciculata]|eukprot:XP_004366595.1 hypothetical protein DFA_04187 [Cavenderia fasciculata]
MTSLFKSLIGSPYIRHLIFNHIKEMTEIEKGIKKWKSRYPNIIMNGHHQENTMDNASKYGLLSTVQLLCQMKQVKFTDVIDKAAENGHYHIVRVKDAQLMPLIKQQKMDIWILSEFLHRAGKTFTNKALSNACLKGDLEIVQFLFQNSTEGWTVRSIINACRKGNFDLIKFIVSNRTEKCSTKAVDAAIKKNCSLDIIKLLDRECTNDGLKYAFENDRMDIVEYLYEKYQTSTGMWTSDIFDEAARYGKLDFVKTLHKRPKGKCTTKVMDEAAQYGHLEVVKFLHLNRSEGCTTDAMNQAAENDHIEIVKFLYFNRTEGCTTDAMDGAAQSSFFLKNQD